MSEAVMYDCQDGIAVLTLNRPETRNPISDPDMIEAILGVLERVEQDLAVRVVILTGAGSAFSSGGNLKKMGAQGGVNDPLPAQTRRNYRYGIQRLPLAFEALDVPGDGGAWLLPRVVGFSKACEMALTGDPVSSDEALACGLLSRVVPDDALMAAARAMAGRIAANPPHAVRMTKRLLREGRTASLPSLLELSAALQALAHATDDHTEAVSSVLERRAGVFTGR